MKIINTNNIMENDFINGRKGEYRAIVKCRGGFMLTVDDLGIQNKKEQQWKSGMDVFNTFKKGALQTIEFRAKNTNTWLTVFARKGNKVLMMDRQMFIDMKVGDINQDWYKSNLYSQRNYNLCNAKTWDDKAFVMNK